jgi:L-threonylcarbamoyladenylate synthase
MQQSPLKRGVRGDFSIPSSSYYMNNPPRILTIEAAVQALHCGEMIAYPTEGVYGLGCDPREPKALHALLQLKQRSPAKGLILVGSHLDQLIPYVDMASLSAARCAEIHATWPGSVTWVLPIRLPSVLPTALCVAAHDQQTLAVRVSAHPVVRALCDHFSGAIVSTSANISGAAPLQSAAAIEHVFGDRIAGVVQGALGGDQKPSRVMDGVTGAILRP